jgi:hypothetical protein
VVGVEGDTSVGREAGINLKVNSTESTTIAGKVELAGMGSNQTRT